MILRLLASKAAFPRFWSKVDFHGPVMPDMGTCCWQWKAYTTQQGYGQFGFAGKICCAHRVAYELLIGPLPPWREHGRTMELDHLCRNPSCVRPLHLELVTHAVNGRRGNSGVVSGAQQRAKTHCPRGHPLSGSNLYVTPRGARSCRECRRAVVRLVRAEQRQRRGATA
jgi:hypothetical protein